MWPRTLARASRRDRERDRAALLVYISMRQYWEVNVIEKVPNA